MKTNQLTPLAIEENNKFKLQKYYWILIKEKSFSGEFTYEKVIDKHPFTWRQNERNQFLPERIWTILNWKEITKEEYELYQTI